MKPDQYFITKNQDVPLNDRPKGEVAPHAIRELQRWQKIANEWGIYPDGRCRRCMECDENIWFAVDDHGREYIYSDEEINALIVAHIRQVHDGS